MVLLRLDGLFALEAGVPTIHDRTCCKMWLTFRNLTKGTYPNRRLSGPRAITIMRMMKAKQSFTLLTNDFFLLLLPFSIELGPFGVQILYIIISFSQGNLSLR